MAAYADLGWTKTGAKDYKGDVSYCQPSEVCLDFLC